MSVDTITGRMAAYQLQSIKADGVTEKSAKSTPATKGQPVNQAEQLITINSETNKISTGNSLQAKQTPAASDTKNSEPAGVVNHVVISYNEEGKLRTKFVDSRNNVVYQTPSELAARLEDQLLTSKTSTNIVA
jgi:hypothetical protein